MLSGFMFPIDSLPALALPAHLPHPAALHPRDRALELPEGLAASPRCGRSSLAMAVFSVGDLLLRPVALPQAAGRLAESESRMRFPWSKTHRRRRARPRRRRRRHRRHAACARRSATSSRSTRSTSPCKRGEIFGFLGPERLGQDHDDPHAVRRRSRRPPAAATRHGLRRRHASPSACARTSATCRRSSRCSRT